MVNRESKFKDELIRVYKLSIAHHYKYMMRHNEVDELMHIYLEEFLTIEKIEKLEADDLLKRMMKQMTAVYRLDPPDVGHEAELVVLVNNVKYDGENLYIQFKKMSPLKMRRFEMGMSVKDLAKETEYTEETVIRCESSACNMAKQPEHLAKKFADALSCEIADISWPEQDNKF